MSARAIEDVASQVPMMSNATLLDSESVNVGALTTADVKVKIATTLALLVGLIQVQTMHSHAD